MGLLPISIIGVLVPLICVEPSGARLKTPLMPIPTNHIADGIPRCWTGVCGCRSSGGLRRGKGFQNVAKARLVSFLVGDVSGTPAKNHEADTRDYSVVRIQLGSGSSGVRIVSPCNSACWSGNISSFGFRKGASITSRNFNVAHINGVGIKGIDRGRRELYIDFSRRLAPAIDKCNVKMDSFAIFRYGGDISPNGHKPSSLGQLQSFSALYDAPRPNNHERNGSEGQHRIVVGEMLPYPTAYAAKTALFILGLSFALWTLICHTIVPSLLRWPISIASLLLAMWVLTLAFS
jgi:hypothetical protein